MRSKDERIIRRKKNFFASLIITTLLWIAWATIFVYVPPEYFLMPLIFLIVTFLAILFTFSLIFANTRRGLLVAIGTVSFMTLRYFGIGNYLNLLLIAGILLSVEYYLSNK